MQPVTIQSSCLVSRQVSGVTLMPILYQRAGFQNAWWINIRKSIPR